MSVELEGARLFTAKPYGRDGHGHLRSILVDRVEQWLKSSHGVTPFSPVGIRRNTLVEEMINQCALRPLALSDSTAVAWSVSSVVDRSDEPRIRIEKAVAFSGDPRLFDFAPRAELTERPRGIITPTAVRFAATAPWESFELVREAVEQVERAVRQYLAWQHLDLADINRELPDIAEERCTLWSRQRPDAYPASVSGIRPSGAVRAARH